MDSDWLYITAGMPQGSPLGLLSFLLLIDDLTVDCLTHKYVDDTMHTLIESVPCGSQQTHMQTFLQQLQTWATPNNGPLAVSVNTYLTLLLTTLSLWKEYSISNLLALLSHTI